MRRKNPFTLVELLVVIVVIAILASLMLPAIATAGRKAKETKCRALIKGLELAIGQFDQTYGYLPVDARELDQGDVQVDYTRLLRDLTGDYEGTGYAVRNTRKLKFLDVDNNKEYKDPWGQNFYVLLDGNYDGKITAGDPAADESLNRLVRGMAANVTEVNGTYLIYSLGADKAPVDINIAPTEKSQRDNIYSVDTDWSQSGHTPK